MHLSDTIIQLGNMYTNNLNIRFIRRHLVPEPPTAALGPRGRIRPRPGQNTRAGSGVGVPGRASSAASPAFGCSGLWASMWRFGLCPRGLAFLVTATRRRAGLMPQLVWETQTEHRGERCFQMGPWEGQRGSARQPGTGQGAQGKSQPSRGPGSSSGHSEACLGCGWLEPHPRGWVGRAGRALHRCGAA